ncbi:hypothetical protein [Pelomonas sp. SE-A7]|uniref:hypothetical protein n=1 Tax=Pelomonas sp. SE-A7 TaxID=3054953 RepID=UPI00259D1579|nr:hypothetical protein [Pelomonas sp. SE-A7]MDM4766028.1 hypothetical protein [Pelomonas sp. SE-A7]
MPFDQWSQALAPAVQERLVLLINHVLSRESVATERLKPQSGRSLVISLGGWPSLLPAAPDLALQVTPAGLFERLDAVPAQPDLRVELDASNPAAMALGAFSGVKPRVTVQGDAALAGEVNWLMANLRWDIADDLASLVGPLAAQQLARFGQAATAALSQLAGVAQGAAGFGARKNP